jgi:hypothetical protein
MIDNGSRYRLAERAHEFLDVIIAKRTAYCRWPELTRTDACDILPDLPKRVCQ